MWKDFLTQVYDITLPREPIVSGGVSKPGAHIVDKETLGELIAKLRALVEQKDKNVPRATKNWVRYIYVLLSATTGGRGGAIRSLKFDSFCLRTNG